MALSGLFVGLVFGFLLQRGQFCFVCGFRDLAQKREPRFLIAVLLAVAIQSVGLLGLQSVGEISLPAEQMPWMATLLGGVLFGVGIALARCCGSGSWFRTGEGAVGSLLTLLMFAITLAACQAGPLKPLLQPLMNDRSTMSTIDRSLGLSPWLCAAALVAAAALLVPWQLRRERARKEADALPLPPTRTMAAAATIAGRATTAASGAGAAPSAVAEPRSRATAGVADIIPPDVAAVSASAVARVDGAPAHRRPLPEPVRDAWHPFLTATLIGLLGVAAWWLSWQSGRNYGYGVAVPTANVLQYLSTGQQRYLNWGSWFVLGLLAGSWLTALVRGEFRWRLPPAWQVRQRLAGGVLMGIGATLAGGCTITNMLVATAYFSWQGWVASATILLGAWLGFFLVDRRPRPHGLLGRR